MQANRREKVMLRIHTGPAEKADGYPFPYRLFPNEPVRAEIELVCSACGHGREATIRSGDKSYYEDIMCLGCRCSGIVNIPEKEPSRSVQRRVAAQRGEETPVFRKGKGMKAKSKATYEWYNWYPYPIPEQRRR